MSEKQFQTGQFRLDGLDMTECVDGITIEFRRCNPLDPYLQWEHIALWQFQFKLKQMIRAANSRVILND